MKNKEKNILPKVVGIIIAVVVLLILAAVGFGFLINNQMENQIENAMVWNEDHNITEEDRTRYADLVLLPVIKDDIETSFIRGIRDPQYKIETKKFETIDDLYGILPFANEEDKESAVSALGEPLSEISVL